MNKHPVFPYDLPPASSTTGGAETASRPVNRKNESRESHSLRKKRARRAREHVQSAP